MKSIIITGAGNGIGKELALAYAKRKDVKLTLISRSIDRLESVAQKCRDLGAETQVHAVDVTDAKQMAKIMEESDPHTVFANAGISGGPGMGNIETIQQTHAIINTNLFGVINTVLPVLGKAKRIVIVSSMAGLRGLPSAPAYSTSKCAVRAWGEALHGLGFPITIVCPGFIKTNMTLENNFPMPFIMTADRAAKTIIKGAENGKRLLIFPFGMRLVAFLMKYLP
ncbi:MAG: SDR family NAD(P)-dependent oxidoreductase, partial [Alphaproteobacteria bacterium]|nr:SDR family NAD(P)-dependent oxidoreductase [Alphaproteobacteria bacterium]